MRSGVVAVLLVAALLATGCLGPEAENNEDPQEPAAPRPWVLENSASDCPEAIGVLLLHPERLQALIPANFTVRDASGFFGLPAPTGQGALFFNSVQCGGQGAGEVGVYVEAPSVDGFETAEFDFYSLGYATDDPQHAANLSAVGAPVENATITATADAPTPLAGQGSGHVQGEDQMRYSFELAATAPQPFELTARFWRAVPTGLVVWEYVLPGQEAFAGALTSCTFPSGSLIATIAEAEDCMGAQTAALLFPEQRFDGRIEYLPGARAE